MRLVFLAILPALGLVAATALGADGPKLPLRLVVDSGQHERIDSRVVFELAEGLDSGVPVRLIETTGGRESAVPAQLDAEGQRLWWIAAGAMAPGSQRTYRLEAGAAAAAPAVATIDSPTAVEVRFDSKPLLRYNKAHVEPPPGIDPRYGRSAHLHPVWTPSGAVVTDELPPDHLHQSGIFLAYTKTQFEGRDVDFWNLAGGKGRVRFKSLDRLASGPVFAEFCTTHEHVDLTAEGSQAEIGATEGGKVALEEQWIVRAWVSGWQAGYWLLDITSRAKCATKSPLRLPQYHYGGMAIRAARPWTPEHVRFLTSEGDDRLQGNHTRVRWCDVSGMVDGRPAGATLMTHPGNFRFPEPLRIHPTMPYMVFTPSYIASWEIRPGRVHESRYQLVIHDGEPPAEMMERLWHDFAQPLRAAKQ